MHDDSYNNYVRLKKRSVQARLSFGLCSPENTATLFLHDVLSLACFSASPHVNSNLRRSFSVLCLQVIFCRPCLRLPVVVFHFRHFFGILLCSILSTCPSHLSLLYFILSTCLSHLPLHEKELILHYCCKV